MAEAMGDQFMVARLASGAGENFMWVVCVLVGVDPRGNTSSFILPLSLTTTGLVFILYYFDPHQLYFNHWYSQMEFLSTQLLRLLLNSRAIISNNYGGFTSDGLTNLPTQEGLHIHPFYQASE